MEIKTVTNEKELKAFFEAVDFFHDALLYEFGFISGSYVDEKRYMYGENNPGVCKMVFQSQNLESPVILVEITGVKIAKIDVNFPLELDGTITDNRIVLYPAGASLKDDFVVSGETLKYCILDSSFLGLGKELIFKTTTAQR